MLNYESDICTVETNSTLFFSRSIILHPVSVCHTSFDYMLRQECRRRVGVCVRVSGDLTLASLLHSLASPVFCCKPSSLSSRLPSIILPPVTRLFLFASVLTTPQQSPLHSTALLCSALFRSVLLAFHLLFVRDKKMKSFSRDTLVS